MLKRIPIEGSSDILQQLNATQPLKQSWIIPDLRTKKSIQSHFLTLHGYYPDDAILRVSDLWKKILFRAFPDVKVLSVQSLQVHVRKFIKKYGGELQLPDGSELTLIRWLRDLAPIYYHSQGEEQLTELWGSQPEHAEHWRDWWLRAKAAFLYLDSMNLIGQPWVSAYLQRVEHIENYWKRNLVLDLGGQLSSLEAGLLQNLSRGSDVLILEPKMKNSKKMNYWLRPYQELAGAAVLEKAGSRESDKSTFKQVEKHSSSLSAIRSATAQIRSWLEQGSLAHEIALVVPEVETIWPTLQFHLKQEGLPCNRERKNNFHGLSEVQIFLARMRALTRNLSSRDLELTLFSQGAQLELSVEKFRALFSHLYDDRDYERHLWAVNSLKNRSQFSQDFTTDEFLILLINQWAEKEVPDWLELVIRQALLEFDQNMKLTWSEWIRYSESVLSALEKTEDDGHEMGIKVASLNSSHFLNVRKVFVLELSEQNLKSSQPMSLSTQTVQKLGRNFGFWLEDREQSPLQFELNWLIQDHFDEIVLSYSEVNLKGDLQTPSEIWLTQAAQLSRREISHLTVVDSLMKSTESKAEKPTTIALSKELTLSPSSFETFVNCPFVFFARHWVGLQIFPEIDLDQDPRDKGQLIHRLFEVILRKMNSQEDLSNDLTELVETVAISLNWVLDPLLWPVHRQRYIKLAKRFIEFETQWRIENFRLKGHHLELKWQGELESVKIKGQIDRLDYSADNELILVDYKNSVGSLKGAHQWLEQQQYQMLFYIAAIKNKWVPEIQGELVAAVFYIVKDFTRKLGWESPENCEGFYSPQGSKKQRLGTEDLNKILEQFYTVYRETVTRIKSGLIEAKPLDPEDCQNCDWRRACRAPHLN